MALTRKAKPPPLARAAKELPPDSSRQDSAELADKLLYPYQQRWLADHARFKVGMFARQTGKTFTATLEIILDCLDAEAHGQRRRWVILSRGERQAKEAMEEGVKRHLTALKIACEILEIPFDATINALEIVLPGGSRITALPANPDTARGFSASVLLDEFAFHLDSHRIWQSLFPVVSAGHRLRVVSTPNGKGNKFHELMTATDFGAVWSRHVVDIHQAVADGLPRDVEELKAGINDPDAWAQEYECSWQATLKGAYFAAELAAARAATPARIGKVPHQPSVLVDTWWDLGMDDSTAIWFSQDVGREIHAIDYYEATGEGLAHYRDVLDRRKAERGYRYGRHHGPHDLAVRELGTGQSRVETARALGIAFTVVPRVEHKADAIQAARSLLGHLWIDETRCARGLVCLESYRKEWDRRLQVFRDRPLHDQYSHAADALMTLACGHRFAVTRQSAAAPAVAAWS